MDGKFYKSKILPNALYVKNSALYLDEKCTQLAYVDNFTQIEEIYAIAVITNTSNSGTVTHSVAHPVNVTYTKSADATSIVVTCVSYADSAVGATTYTISERS